LLANAGTLEKNINFYVISSIHHFKVLRSKYYNIKWDLNVSIEIVTQ